MQIQRVHVQFNYNSKPLELIISKGKRPSAQGKVSQPKKKANIPDQRTQNFGTRVCTGREPAKLKDAL